MNNIPKDIAEIQKQVEAKRAAVLAKKAELDAQLEKEVGTLTEGLKAKFLEATQVAVSVLAAIPESEHVALLVNDGNLAFLQDARQSIIAPRPTGVARKKGGAANLGRRSKVSDADLLAFLTTVRSTPEIAKHFSLSNPSQRLNGLLKAGKVTMEDEGNKKTWKKAPTNDGSIGKAVNDALNRSK